MEMIKITLTYCRILLGINISLLLLQNNIKTVLYDLLIELLYMTRK